MKKICLCLTLAAVFLLTAVCPAFAAPLGTAADVLASDVTLIKSGLAGEKMIFCDTDFKTALGVSDLKSITVITLPSSTTGTLLLGGRRVGTNQTVKRRHLAALVFVPASPSVTEATFTFTAEGLAGGAAITCTMKFLDRVNYAPRADGAVSVFTQSGIPVFGKMAGCDPEGDACEFIVLRYPENGTLTVTDKTTGAYRYTPLKNKTGKDSFSYVIRDCYGNYSEVCHAQIRVDERMSDVVYVDMEDSPAYQAAVAMDALGVMHGKVVGDQSFFSPEETVSRAEFVAMAMKTCGIRADSTLTATFFDDNADIPAPLVGYIATAQRIGIVNGTFSGGKLTFRPNDEITGLDAAVILSRLIGESKTGTTAGKSSVPVWARAGVATLASLGILDEGTASADRKLTRADVAEALYHVRLWKEKR